MASVADIKKRLQKNGITERTRDPYKTDSSKESGYVGSDAFQKIKERVKSSGVSFDINDDYINTFLSDANDFITTAKTDYEGIGWSNASSTYTARDEAWVDLSNRADYIGTWLKHNKDRLDPDTYNSLSNSLNSISSNMNPIMDGFRESRRFYSQWETEEDYNKAVEAQKEYDALLNFDLEEGRREIAIKESVLEHSKKNFLKENGLFSDSPSELYGAWFEQTGGELYEEYQRLIRDREAELSEMKRYYTLAERLQNGVALTEDAVNAPDFDNYANKGNEAGKEPSIWDKFNGSYNHIAYLRNNPENLATYEEAAKASNGASWGTTERVAKDQITYKAAKYMTDEEFKVYNYYYAMDAENGTNNAEKYLENIEEALNHRQGSAMFEKIEEKPFLEYMFGVEAGLDQFESGMENLFSNEDYIPLSATQIASGMVREDLGDVGFNLPEWMGGSSIGQVGYDLTTTTSNMLPSILVSFVPGVGQVASPTLLGASAAGNAKAEMLRLGYSKEQANTYGILVGASEGLLQYALGGISALGGKVSGNVISKMVSQIDNGLAKAAIKLGGNMVSEGVEEALQSILEPVFKSITTGEELEAVNWEEVVYSGILGMLSAGAFEGTGAVANGVASGVDYLQQVKRHGQGIIDRGGVDSLKALAMDVAGANQNSLGQKVASGLGKVNHKASAMNVGKLSASIEKTMSSQDKADLTNALVKKGMSEKEAVLTAKYLMGEVELSEAQVAKIEGNADVIAVVDELMNKADSAINERARSLMVARRGNASEAKAKSVAPKATKSGDMDVKVEVNVDGKVSKSGKTTRKSTGEAVTINKDNAIAKVDDNGVVYFNTDQGEVAEADIEYANESEALVYEAFVDMTPGMANAIIKNYDGSVPAQTYIDGMREGVLLYGMHNFQAVGKDISNASTFAELSDTDQDFALKLGRTMAKTEAEAKEASIRKTTEKAEKSAPTKKTKGGRVSFEGGVKAKTKDQKKAVRLARYLSSAIGIDIVFYDARTTSNPYGKDSNGYYDKTTNSIHLDIQGAHNDTKTIAFTLSHEVVHFIKEWSPEKFNTFASFLMEQYAEHGVDTSTLLANKMAELKNTNADEVYEEMICDACETMLLDSNAMVKLMQLRQTDLTLFEKLKLHIMELLTALREAYRKLGYEATTDEAKALLKMTDVLDKLHTMFEEAAVDATQNFQAEQGLTTESVSVSEDGTVRLQMKQYQQTGRATLLNYLREQYGSEDANDLITTIDNIYDTLVEFKNNEALSVFSNWQDTDVELDENGHPIFTTSIKNGDYELNQDFSRVCKKRRQLDFVLNMLAEDPAFEASHLTKGDFVKINKAIKSHGFEIACALCFVDSKRFRQAEWADSFANTWNDILNAVVKDGSKLTPFNFATKNPNISDEGIEIDTGKAVTYRKWSDGKEDVKNRQTYESFEKMLSKGDDGKWFEGNANVRTIATLIRDNPELRHTFRGADIIASHGFDTIQRLAPSIRSILDGWGGSSVPKPSSNDTIYDNSILNISGYKKDTAYAMGGVRMNSFSDFMAHMFFDYCQAFADLSAKELPSQAYTKELTYVRFFGRSGQKINMSGIAAIRDDALPTTAQKGVTKAEAEANEKIEKMIAGLDVTRLLEHLGKDIYHLTEADVEQFLDMCDYVWADESINMKHATLLQTGILYDRLSESKVEECYELLKAGEIERALQVAGEENVDTEYAKHCGTIVVGVSDAHIRKLLRDPTVRMVIPYHKSGLNPVIARELRISAYNDYTLAQTTGVKRKGSKTSDKIGSKAIKDAYGLKDFEFYDWFGKTIDGKLYDGKATADKYLEWCEKGYYDEAVGDYVYYTTKGEGYILAKDFHKKATIIPKFDAFMGEENYYKVLEDFDCYNTITGEHSAQGAVDLLRMGLPSDYKQVLKTALEDEQQVSDDFRDHLDNKGLKEEVMDIVKARGYEPSDMGSTLDNIVDAVGAENVAEVTEQYTDVENTARIKKQQKKTSDNTYEAIGKELLYYEEGDLAPDLTLVETVNDRTGNKEVTIKHYGQKPKDYIPKKIAYCYKLFEQHPDGTLHALFAGATKSVPLNEWRYAQGFPRTDAGVKGMNLRERYGWHLSAGLPSAPHLMSSKDFNRGYPSKGAYGHPKGSKRVWVRMAYDASTDFNSIADSTGKQNDIYGLIPFGGYYAFKENNQSEWVISSAVKIDKILTEEERQQILKEEGYDEYEAWRLKYQPTPEERAARELANKERAKAKARAKKLGIDSELSESTKAMRDAIKSRIIDNPELTKGIKKQVKPRSAQAQRDEGYMLNETKFNQFYSAHKLDIGKRWGDILAQIESIKREGFKGGSGTINTLPVGISNIRMYNGEPVFTDVIQKAYAPKKGDYVLLVPKNWVNKTYKVIEGFKPLDYEVVQVERDYQPYYELYEKAYKEHNEGIKKQVKKNPSTYAPTFYSAMSRVVDDIKMDKIGASSLVPYLKGKGIKHDEIKWSGIEAWLEGKKSVTKADLQEFLAGSSLEIQEQMSNKMPYDIIKDGNNYLVKHKNGIIIDTWEYTENPGDPDLVGWMSEDTGDIVTSVEELKSYVSDSYDDIGTRWGDYKLDGGTNYRELVFVMPNSSYSNQAMRAHWGVDAEGVLAHARIQDMTTKDGKKMLFVEEIQSDWHNDGTKYGYRGDDVTKKYEADRERYVEKHIDKDWGEGQYAIFKEDPSFLSKGEIEFIDGYIKTLQRDWELKHSKKEYEGKLVPDAPFHNTYHEYVLKRLLRMAAEEGYDSLGWTPADIQADRWSYDYEEGYKIEYDQDIPKFLRKYGKKWGATVGTAKTTEGYDVWSMDITEAMEQSVLYEGQPKFQKKRIPNNADEIAKEHFGTTNKWSETGWLLRDGTQLDFSGRHWERDPNSEIDLGESYYSGRRNMEHYEIAEAFPEYSGMTDMTNRGEILDDFLSNGSIRIVGKGCIDLFTMPTDEQFIKLASYFGENRNRHIVIGIGQDGLEYKEGTNASTIIEGIRDYFLKNRANQSDLMRFHTDDDGVLFQKKKLSNRTILANALETTIDTSTQEGKNARKWLKEYKSKIDFIEKEEARLAELKSEIYAISFTKGADRSKLTSLNEEKQKTANRIHTYDKQLTRLESMKPIKDVLERERERVRKRTAEKGREAMKEAVKQTRESRDKAEATKKLQKLVLETARWLKNPTKTEVKCPDLLKPAYAEFLDGIDLSSKRLLKGGDPTQNDLKIASAMDSLATAIERIKNAQDPNVATDAVLDSGYLDLPDDFVRKLREMAEGIKKLMVGTDGAINRMSSSEIKQIAKLIRTLNHAIKEMSKLYANLRFANVEELGDNTMTFTDDMGEAKNTNAVSDFVGWDNAMPYYAFKRFGVGGESIFEGLADGQDKLANLAKAIFDFKEKTWTDKEAKAWGEDTHTIELPSGGSLTLTSADAMGIYCLSRRAQGLQHLLGGGTRVIGLKKGMKKASDSRSTLTQEDVNTIVDSLSKRQVEVANAIQGFMSTVCSGWGNEISMKRFLTEEFNEEFYYPIESNDENLETQDPKAQQSDLFRLLNISATKALTPGANNEVIIRNIFEVFTNHASDMARLNAFGMPLLDYMKWLNYREKTVNDDGQITVRGVRKSMKRTYGDKAINYVINLIKDVNGRHNDNGDNSFLMGMMRASKTASVGNNLRVAFLQFTSYPRASMVLSAGSLAKGVAKVPQIEKAKKYCGIALWKSFGFYDTNIARSIEDQIKGATNVRQKIIELSMKTPEWADAITWGALWNACEYEVAKTTKNKAGSEEFYQEVGAKLREVVYATQVVDSVLTRSQIMRSKSGLTQLATAYMSEPTLTSNILMDALFQFYREHRVTGDVNLAWKKTRKIVIGAAANYCILALLTALAESLADAWRDDDDDEFYEKFRKVFFGNYVANIIPFNKIPIISDIADLILSRFGIGFVSSDNLATSWITQTADALDVWAEVLGEKFGGEETSKTVYNAIYKTAKALSSMTGVSVSGAMREVVTLWNNTAGVYDTTLKIKSYEPTNEELGQELYEAILDGNDRQADSLEAQFDDQKAIDNAIRKALRENDPRILAAAVAWHEGNIAEYSRIFDEMEAEGNFTTDIIKSAIESERNELKGDTESTDKEDKVESRYETEHYYTAIAKGDVITANKVLKDLIDTEVANGKSREDAEESIATGFRSNCREAYLNGEIDRSKAMDMLVKYGGKDTNDSYWELKKWDYIVANGSDDGYSKYNSFHEAVRTGKNLRAVISEYTTHGVTASTLSGQITSYFKPLYINMSNSERASIKGYLLNAYELLGYNRNEKNKDINKWLE